MASLLINLLTVIHENQGLEPVASFLLLRWNRFHLRIPTLGVREPCPPNILTQQNPDVVVIDVHFVFLAGMRTSTQRGCVFGQKQGIQLA